MVKRNTTEFKEVRISVKNFAISVEPETVKMGKGSNQYIQWEIVTHGWEFPEFEDGIEVKGDHGEFSNGRLNETGTIYILHNKNSHKHFYPYTIKVTNGKTTLVYDPGIANGGGQG
jgi:hypothetical protein